MRAVELVILYKIHLKVSRASKRSLSKGHKEMGNGLTWLLFGKHLQSVFHFNRSREWLILTISYRLIVWGDDWWVPMSYHIGSSRSKDQWCLFGTDPEPVENDVFQEVLLPSRPYWSGSKSGENASTQLVRVLNFQMRPYDRKLVSIGDIAWQNVGFPSPAVPKWKFSKLHSFKSKKMNWDHCDIT